VIVKGRHGAIAVESRAANLDALIRATGGHLRSAKGVSVTGREVAGLPAFRQAIRIASEAIGKHRMRVWRGEDVDRRPVKSTWQARLFAGQPNDLYPWFYAWECTEASLTARNNAYWLKKYDEQLHVAEIYVVHPDAITVRWNRERGHVEYRVPLELGKPSEWLTSRDILRFRVGAVAPGQIIAPSPIEEHRRAWAAALSKQQAEESFYTSGSMKAVAVIFPEKVDPGQAERWKQLYLGDGGIEEGSQVKVFGGDPRIETIGLSLAEQQFVESQAFAIEDVGRMLGVPPSLLWAASKEGSKPITPEHEEDRWTRYGLEPRRQRIEQTVAHDPAFFGPSARDYPMFDIRRVRGDAITESRMLVTEVQSGILLPDEARAELGLPPLPDGAGQIPQVVPVGGAPNPDPFGGDPMPVDE
jgi:HK97 family phage portal protein